MEQGGKIGHLYSCSSAAEKRKKAASVREVGVLIGIGASLNLTSLVC